MLECWSAVAAAPGTLTLDDEANRKIRARWLEWRDKGWPVAFAYHLADLGVESPQSLTWNHLLTIERWPRMGRKTAEMVAAKAGLGPRPDTADDLSLSRMNSEMMAQELRRRGWRVMPPAR